MTPTFVPYDPNCTTSNTLGNCGGQLVAFNVYTRADANYLYVAAQALPAKGDRWNDAVVLGNNILANIYLDTDLKDGSDILILPGGDDCTPFPGYENQNGTTCNETHFGPAGTSVYYVANGGSPGGLNDDPPGQGGVAEMAIPWTVLQHDPDNIGFPKVVCKVNVRILQAFGNWFSGAQFGRKRFGTFTAPSCACHEGDGNGHFRGDHGDGNVDADSDGCIDGDEDHVDSDNRGDGKDFHSTSIDSVTLNSLGDTMTIAGTGTSAGAPVTFVLVEVASTPLTPGSVSWTFSDGFINTGDLLDGSISLN